MSDSPPATIVREALERLLASETFGRSERARRLIRYLVEREQAGQADHLKGISIAIDVFGKDGAFDASTDAVVRVQAGRLRALLAQYYNGEGASDTLRITIPRGGYVPAYEVAPAPDAAPVPPIPAVQAPGETDLAPPAADIDAALPAPPPSIARMGRQLRLLWVAVFAMVAIIGILAARVLVPVDPATEIAAGAIRANAQTTGSIQPAIAEETLPPVYIHVDESDPAASRVAAVLRTGLSRFDTVDLIGRTMEESDDAPPGPLQFLFTVGAGPTPGSVTVELQHVLSGKVLDSRILPPQDVVEPMLDDRVADILTSAVPVSGSIYGYLQQNNLQSGLVACMLLTDEYYLAQTPERHLAAYRCLEELVARDARSPLVYAEMASLLLESVTDRYKYPKDASVEKALELGYRALQMNPKSPYANRAYGFINAGGGKIVESIRWMRKAYEHNTYDLGMGASYGYALIFAGEFEEGTPIMRRAVDAGGGHPTWWDYGYFLGAYMQEDMNAARNASEALATARKPHYLAARAIIAEEDGSPDLAAKLVSELLADHTKFAADPRAFYVGAQYPEALVDKLVDALRRAGLGRAS